MNCKLTTLLAAVALGAISQAASAADLPARPVYREPAVVPAVANWTGVYVGLGGGYGLFDVDNTGFRTSVGPATPIGLATASNGTTGGKGYFGRVQIGYDQKIAGSWVVGVFADYDFSSIKGTIADVLTPGVIPLKQTSAWAAGGRIGYLVNPQFLTFFDGGYANARFKGGAETFTTVCVGCFVGASGITLGNQNYNGYFLGGGTEYMIFPGWFVKSEYRLASYSAKTTAALVGPPASTGGGITASSFAIKPVVQTITAELVYKFNWGR